MTARAARRYDTPVSRSYSKTRRPWCLGSEAYVAYHDRDLLDRGFKFVGSTICYAYVQTTGMVNDHLVGCFRHPQLQAKR
jgi:hypothetical protein